MQHLDTTKLSDTDRAAQAKLLETVSAWEADRWSKIALPIEAIDQRVSQYEKQLERLQFTGNRDAALMAYAKIEECYAISKRVLPPTKRDRIAKLVTEAAMKGKPELDVSIDVPPGLAAQTEKVVPPQPAHVVPVPAPPSKPVVTAQVTTIPTPPPPKVDAPNAVPIHGLNEVPDVKKEDGVANSVNPLDDPGQPPV